jgi:hypothetical protein
VLVRRSIADILPCYSKVGRTSIIFSSLVVGFIKSIFSLYVVIGYAGLLDHTVRMWKDRETCWWTPKDSRSQSRSTRTTEYEPSKSSLGQDQGMDHFCEFYSCF